MTKISTYLLTTLGTLLFVSCHSYVESVKIKTYKAKDYITKELKVYEPKELLYPILDSIITKTRECPEYEGTKDCQSFYFSLRKEPIYGLENKKEYPYLSISAIYYVPRLTYHRRTKAVFYYKGCNFYISGSFMTPFLLQTDRTTSIKCIDPDKYQFEVLQRGDKDMFWGYLYKNNVLHNICYGRCATP
ncbi:hypothetical protein [Bacteroides oleiciplenus]|uniref:Lipoprotein n=1 Tax=Bacteroides oleiciplenus TaxID=626931 RepID=A0A3E5B9V1_9BACE|nr:hypothetical protein [Bacteroides oleiciplenus]RGN34336.1 hypothetical protein DXB65_14760 [Bacteroides oleiciplenus]